MDSVKWRAEFPSCQRYVHMNHAGLAPVSRRVADVLRAFADEALLIDPEMYGRWEARAEEVRTTFARFVGAQAEEVAFVRNTSEGISLVAAGLEWRQGDNLIAVADEYPANVYPWWGLRNRGVETRMLVRRGWRFSVDDVRALVDGRTRLVTVSAVDWQSGFRADLPALGDFCRQRGLLFCVDAVQALGALRVDVAAAGIDCLAAGGHKWLLAPEGCGALFASSRVAERINPVLLGWKSVRDAERYLPYHFEMRKDAKRFEPGTLSHVGILALGAALDLLFEAGIDEIEQRILHLTAELAEGLRSRGAEIVSPWEEGERSGILTFRLGDAVRLSAVLKEAGIIVRNRAAGVRLAPHFYNDGEDVARVLEAVDAYLG